jgi:Ca2+-binding EF-hand superfamily protein
MINLFTTLFILASFTDAQTAQRVDMNLFMKSCDKNADHRIDREEYQMYLSESFFFVDKDKDGYLVMDEVQIPVREMDHQKLANADKDNDGKLSIYEFCNAMHKDFEKADSNDDGTIDMGELESLMLETK